MKGNYYFVLLLMIFTACSANYSNDSFKNHSRAIENGFLPYFLYDFFPDKKVSNPIYYSTNALDVYDAPFVPSEFDVFYKLEIHSYKLEQRDSIINIAKIYAVHEFLAKDTNYLIMTSQKSFERLYEKDKIQETIDRKKNKPIVLYFGDIVPDFDQIELDPSTLSNLPESFKIMIIKTGNKRIINKNIIFEWCVLPRNLKHGYSSGICYNEELPYIIFWAAAW